MPSQKTRVCDIGFKVCTECLVELPVSEFYPQRKDTRKDGGITQVWFSKCKKCDREVIKQRRIKKYGSLVKYNRARALKKFNLKLENWDHMYAEQKGLCAICNISFEESDDGRINLDHCHKTNTPRKLLCSACNKGLGSFRDNPNVLRKAATYVEEFKDVT